MLFPEEVGLQQVLENVGVGANGALKGVNLGIRSCDLYTVLIYRTFFSGLKQCRAAAPCTCSSLVGVTQASSPGQGPGYNNSTQDPEHQPLTDSYVCSKGFLLPHFPGISESGHIL